MRIRPGPGQWRLPRLLHALADLSGHGKAALALHLVGFDEEDVATGRRPGQTDSHAGALGALGDLSVDTDLDPAQELLDNLARDHQLLGLPFGDPARLLAANGADVPLQVAHACLPRVVAADEGNRVFRKIDLLPLYHLFFDLLGHSGTLR